MISVLKKVRDRLDQIGSEPTPVFYEAKRIWDKRDDEQPYAKLNDCESKAHNRYGVKIDLLDLSGGAIPENRSMYINENPAVGENPNRNKQHGFHFTADNCIGCHACEAACSEKNENPAHISFRSVGYVEGGTYPDYKRMNISMACNHCDDPVCLKGCPTRAYTKHAEYGAVLQDPDTCFGCGYCTWVCPYNAPQLDPIKGQVSKCNMCVDRLEEGLKPACVSACLGNALNFGVIENVPENREQILTQIPGFPDPSITQPNIRFQQVKTMPNEVTRTDSMPVKYHKSEDGQFKPVIDQKKGKARHWNFERLSSRENPLVIFTLATQAAIGAFIAVFLAPWLGIESIAAIENSVLYVPMLVVFFALQAWGLFLSTMHLGKPMRFYRGFNNLRYSPVSREGLGVAMFMAGLGGFTFLKLVNLWLQWNVVEILAQVAGAFAMVAGLIGLWYMHKSYRIKARPFWNHWQVITSFFGTLFSLGAVLLALFLLPVALVNDANVVTLVNVLGAMALVGLVAESVGLIQHAKDMNRNNGEGGSSHYIQCTTFGKTYGLRNVLLGSAVLLAAIMLLPLADGFAVAVAGLLGLATLSALLIGRALFYVLVIPTTMPGAFFWKNKGFEEHARDIGLANMPQVGVVPHLH